MKQTRKTAITTFCRECMGCDRLRGGTVGPSWLSAAHMVRNCTDPGCPLFPYRNGTVDGNIIAETPQKAASPEAGIAKLDQAQG